MNTSNFCVISITVVLLTGYLNFGYTNHIPSSASATSKSWPTTTNTTNLSAYPTSYFTLPGGVNFTFYDPILTLVNKTRSIPNLVARHGDFKLLQAVLLKAVGAIFAGIAIIIAEAFKLKKQKHESKPLPAPPPPSISYGGVPASSYDTPPSSSYGAPPSSSHDTPPASSYGAPPSSSYGAPPASSYGTPPSSSYGAPPSSSYGVPPSTYMKPNR
ncbi:unnamed protein product [Orchesella dallaii]|uniref:Uncharacterized protein n=1 Tax=Orchesella dallaii TaxID=48710 RepID=A0ABP1PRP3_9HEXA